MHNGHMITQDFGELDQIVTAYIEEKNIPLEHGVTHDIFFAALVDLALRQGRGYAQNHTPSLVYERTGHVATEGAIVIDLENPVKSIYGALSGNLVVFGLCPLTGTEYLLSAKFNGEREGKAQRTWTCEPKDLINTVISRLDRAFGVEPAKQAFQEARSEITNGAKPEPAKNRRGFFFSILRRMTGIPEGLKP